MENAESLHTFKVRELFINFNLDSIEVSKKEIVKMTNRDSKRKFIIELFGYALKVIIDDIINKGTQFHLPTKYFSESYICLQRITGYEYEQSRKNGAYKDIDPFFSNFSGYRLEININLPTGNILRIPLYTDSKRKARIAELANSQKIKLGIVKTYKDYYEEILKKYPLITTRDLYRILDYGFFSIRYLLFHGADFSSKSKEFLLQSGSIYRNKSIMIEYVMKKLRIKALILYRRLKYVWDGYSYFSLNRERYEFLKDSIKKHKKINFGEVYLHKCYDDAFFAAYGRKAIFKVKAGDPKKRLFNIQFLETKDYELLEVIDNWDWEILSFKKREYQTIIPYKKSIQKIYRNHLKKFKSWENNKYYNKHKK